jgi:hypothetical protein
MKIRKYDALLLLLAFCILLNCAESAKIKKFKYRADGNQFPSCPIKTLQIDGTCTEDLLANPLLKALPEQLAELKPVVDKILSSLNLEMTPALNLSALPSLCLGDFLGDTVVNDEKFKPTNCDDLPLKTGDKKWGLLNIRVPQIPACGRIEFCVAFDLCGSLAIGMSKDVVTCIANLIPAGQVIYPFLAALGDFTVSISFSRNLEKQIKILQITQEENNYKSKINPFKMPGNFYIGAGLTLPFLDFRLGTISLGDLIAFEGKLGVMLDFGPGPDPEVLKSISKEISQQKNLVELSKFLRTKIKLGGGACFFIDDGDFTIKLNDLTSGLIPDIGLDNADAYVFFQFGDEPNRGIKKGFYVNLSASVNFSLGPLIDKFLGQSIQGILDLLKIDIPRENSLESNLSITVTDDVTAVFLAINSKYSIECYFPKGGKIGCKINDPGDNKFFTACKINNF